MNPFLITMILMLIPASLIAQDTDKFPEQSARDYTGFTFKGYRIVNAQTNETAKKRNLEFNIAHRFGDIASVTGGAHSLFGFDNASDIRFSFDYGITDRLMAGIGRAKGIDPVFELYDGNLKFKLLRQTTDNKIPLAVTLYSVAAVSARRPSGDEFSEGSYPNFVDRWSYLGQVIIARKFSRSLSVGVLPTYLHRNFVGFNDENDLFSIGAGARMKISKRFAVVADYFHTFSEYRKNLADVTTGEKIFSAPLSVGVEIETGGHVFTLNFTNSTGIIENEFIPFTRSSWLKGEFRFGFNVSRNFVLGAGK